MDTIIYYSEMEGISLEHLKRSSGYDMRSNHFHNEYEIYFLTEGERLFFFKQPCLSGEKRQPDPGGYKSDPYDTCSGG